MRYACRRCDWRPDRDDDLPPRLQLAEHAGDADHPLCVVCGVSLERQELQTCTECVAEVRANLASILDLYALLPRELGHATAAPPDSPAARATGTKVPGGEALVMLSPGSPGALWRGRREQSRLARTPWRSPQEVSNATEDRPAAALEANDNLPTDPPSVAFELCRWEDDWRSTRREPAAQAPPSVSGAVAYLSPNTGWAGMYHPAFDEFAADVHRLLKRLVAVTAHDEWAQIGVACLDCGANLHRDYGQDDYRCPRCRRTYDRASFWLAVKASMAEEMMGQEGEESA